MVHTIPLLVVMALFFLLASIGVQLIVSKTIDHKVLSDHHSIVDPLLGVIGTLYSVLLGFMVGGAMARYEDASTNVDMEANSIGNVIRLAQGFESLDRSRIRSLCRVYSTKVVSVEWEQMKQQKTVDGAFDAYHQLWEACLAVQPGENERISNIQQSVLESMNSLGENRRLRIVTSQHGLNIAQWLVIGVGSAITVLFCMFFPVNKASFQLFLTGLVAVSLGLNVWLLAEYSTPFAGEMQIQPYMFTYNVIKPLNMPDTPSRYLTDEDKAKDESTSTDKKDKP